MPGIQQLLNIYPSGGYQIANSLRFRSSASAYLNRTQASGNTQKFTLSQWVKRGKLGATQYLFTAFNASTDGIDFSSADQLEIFFANGSTYDLITTSVYRDPSAWYHIVVSVDTTQATAANRVQLYVNGVSISLTGTQPTQNYNFPNINNNAVAARIGTQSTGVNYFDGYLADVNFIDGQALTPSSFGQISTITGVWQPIAYSGTYGTNGFKLNFSNGTSTTTLGYDSSGNGNNWTTNNISLTSGSTYDWMIDSPTPFAGSSYGVGNYAVWNAIKLQGNSASNANLTATLTAGGPPYLAGYGVRSTMAAPSSGKWYCEITPVSSDTWSYVGVTDINGWATDVGNSGQYSVLYRANGDKNVNGTASSYGASYTTDTIGIALDIDSGTVTFYKNNTSQGAISLPSSTISYCFVVSNGNAQAVSFNANFGQRPFAYTPPSGYKSLCTYNLPAASIVNGASYMAATTYTGNGSTQSITNTVNGVSFQPDFVWVKDRTQAYSHSLSDSVRGVTNVLRSNLTNAEAATPSGGYPSTTTTTGFTVVAGSTDAANVNLNGDTYVGWQWKANGTAVSNTAGSITSQVSANTTAGFSVVTYTMNGSASATIGHGLGVKPAMIIFKDRSSTQEWGVYHQSLGATQALSLNTTGAANVWNGWFNNTEPTSSVMTLSRNNNTSGDLALAYCFAAIPGYSAFGSYTGNGSADGPFVFTNFRPRWIMIKRTDTTSNWVIVDSSRNVYNPQDLNLYPNLSAAEDDYTSTYPFDMLSNGFKFRANYGNVNSSGGTYIYAAFAESAFINSLAR